MDGTTREPQLELWSVALESHVREQGLGGSAFFSLLFSFSKWGEWIGLGGAWTEEPWEQIKYSSGRPGLPGVNLLALCKYHSVRRSGLPSVAALRSGSSLSA